MQPLKILHQIPEMKEQTLNVKKNKPSTKLSNFNDIVYFIFLRFNITG
jgi:hypothetical protein